MQKTPNKEQSLPIDNHCSTTNMAGFRLLLGTMVLAACLFVVERASSQTTNALDYASDPAYSGDGPPNGLGTGGQNGGFGFGAWTFTLAGSGGSFISGTGPSGDSFDLWNTSANSGTVAARFFSAPLSPGQSFLVSIRLNSLDNGLTTNRFALEDASGNILFSYWHVGFEANANNGEYSDASTSQGSAVNFQYAYQQFVTYKFTLNSATTYTFTDLGTGASFTGTIANTPIAQVAFIRGNGNTSPGNGQDYQFDQLQIISAAPPSFQALSPAPNSLSVATNSTISLSVVSGGVPLNTGSVSLTLDGNAVSATVTGNSSLMGISYTPGQGLGFGTLHTVQVVVQDDNTVPYTNSWSFTTGYSSLPVTVPGPFTVSNGSDLTLFTAAGDSWLGTNYQGGSSRTIYARASINVLDNAGETGGGGFYCGFHFFETNTERLIFGNNWPSTNWSVDAKEAGAFDVPPVTPIVLNQWHTMVARIDYTPGQDANVQVWLDPDFTKTEANQPNAPLQTTMINTFDNIRLRCGNGTNAITEFSNIVVAATAPAVGFAVPAAPQFQGFVPARGAVDVSDATPIDVNVVVGGSPINNSSVVLTLDGATVSPAVSSSGGIISVSYTPASHLSDGQVHTAQIVVTDSGNTSYTNSWSFTTGFASLPAILPGPFSTSNLLDVTISSSGNDAWIGTNYSANSSKTLYVQYRMEFNSTNDTGGVTWGGLEFYQDNNERLLVGKNGGSPNWSTAYNAANEPDLTPVTTVNTNEWHTFVVRVDYSPGSPATANIWLDPDLTQPEVNQPNPPETLTIDNTFNNIRLRCGFNDAMDTFSNVIVSAVSVFPPGGPASFQGFVPGQNASSAPVSSPVSVDVVFGSYGVNTNTVVLNLDGTNVAPAFVVSPTSMAVNYQPPTPFAAGSAHTVTVSVTDSNGTPYSTSWSFTADPYPSLPVTQAGPLDAYTGSDVILYNSQNEWIGGNYGPNSSNTLYTTFSMSFFSLNGETGSGGGFGGLHFFQDNTEVLLIGNAWFSTNWSVDAAGFQVDLVPTLPVVLFEWHTLVARIDFVPGANDHVKIWMDPDFTKTEDNQPVPPTTLNVNCSFNNVHLRAGNGSAQTEFTNIVMSAASPFAAPVQLGSLTMANIGASHQLSWTSGGILQVAPTVTGPWTDAPSQANPQTITATNTSAFYRLRQ